MLLDNLERVSASEVRDTFSDTLNRVAFGNERLILVRNGKEVAALISVKDLEWLRQLEDHVDVAAMQRALAATKGLTEFGQIRRARKLNK